MGLFSKEKISKGGDKKGKREEKRISREARNINKQAIYIAPNQKSNQGRIMPLSPHEAKYHKTLNL